MLATLIAEFGLQHVADELLRFADENPGQPVNWRVEAQRLRDRELLVRRSAVRHGLSEDDARERLQRLFAPIVEP